MLCYWMILWLIDLLNFVSGSFVHCDPHIVSVVFVPTIYRFDMMTMMKMRVHSQIQHSNKVRQFQFDYKHHFLLNWPPHLSKISTIFTRINWWVLIFHWFFYFFQLMLSIILLYLYNHYYNLNYTTFDT